MIEKILALTAVTLVVAVASPVFAGTAFNTDTGKIARIDPARMTITLDDGMEFVVHRGLPMENLRVGETVSLTWKQEEGGHHYVTKIKALD